MSKTTGGIYRPDLLRVGDFVISTENGCDYVIKYLANSGEVFLDAVDGNSGHMAMVYGLTMHGDRRLVHARRVWTAKKGGAQ